ncbi:SDR family NAD(P)-dependent oxidoreductase [Micromonospora sp. NPDC006766]|uniref:SDR family NAD(P)-dependent oxidoreductase n=1 Tax=Micromonospora sp. NPDC006766 TaxID=3154778 RepID=UPI0033DDCF29
MSPRVIAIAPCGALEFSPRLVSAVTAGGGLGVLDLAGGGPRALRALRRAVTRGPVGVRVPRGCVVDPADLRELGVATVVVEPGSDLDTTGFTVLVEVVDLQEAERAVAGGAHGIIARGMEAGGRVGDLSSFVLLQQLVDAIDAPIWVCGGIGPRAAAASVIGGAYGVVLDAQLALMPESDLPDDAIAAIRRMDGSETITVGRTRGIRRAFHSEELLPIGQDGWLASVFAGRFRDTAAAVRDIRSVIEGAGNDDTAGRLLSEGSPFAQSLGIRVPVAQGPMTRVSDEPGFAAAVADAGGLPFIALALADGDRSRSMLRNASAALADRPWGVGILGFVPDELRAAQLEAIREVRPPCAIVAGGRPAQAAALEAEGITTFLHVPSPGLLRQFLQAGARKFVFEGAECGGHVGPRASLPLWEQQLTVLDELDDVSDLHLLFAGGIHDARSAAMVATMASPLARRGSKVGVLMGTAYLFTREAVQTGAIAPRFQLEALRATRTSLLLTAPGHATRALHSPFVDDFHRLQADLAAADAESRKLWQQLERLNNGRLRIASKGVKRDGDRLVRVDEATQATQGLFMAGQIAVLRDATLSVAELHDEVTVRAAEFHEARAEALRDRPAVARPAAQPLDIAIIGMSCAFPGSPDLDGYWQTILSARDAITEVPTHRWDADIYYAPEVGPGEAGRYSSSKWGGFIEPVPFDAIHYGIPPAALSSIDPTQLLALEMARRALADAGCSSADHSRTGVVFGAEAGSDMGHAQTLRTMLPSYLGEVPEELAELLPEVSEDSFPGVLANVIAGRVANRLDLGGPNFTIDAACASSLAALDAACKELASGNSDMMICGAADLHNGINDYLMFTSAHALSPTGKCRTFDSTGDGITLGEGVACLVLKRLADAERNGDRVYAVIKGVGASSDGRALGLTAPRAEGQRRALDRAYATAGLSPRQIGLIEAHGTGTVVGDRTELQTLTTMFTESGAAPGACVLGSVKSQIGHTKCAAGLAGIIKASLALHHGVKPPTVNLTKPNPAWDPERSPFAFYTEARPWLAADRYAGVSAFGFGGTNYHTVLAAYRPEEARHARNEWPAELFLFRSTDAMREMAQRLTWTDALGRPWRLRDLAAALVREPGGPVRAAIVARDRQELSTLLTRALAGEHAPAQGLIRGDTIDGKVAFLFPGQGSQRVGALAELYVSFPELREYLDPALAAMLYPPAFGDERAQADRVRDTRVAQPLLGACGLAVDHLLRRVGVRPDMAGGHSYGELVALSVADAFDGSTLMRLSRERAEAILGAAGEDPGTMAAVAAAPQEVSCLPGVVLANHNAPNQVVISGPTDAVRDMVTRLREAGKQVRPLEVACAFHSPVIAGGVDRFAEVLRDTPMAKTVIPVWSNRSAESYPADPDSMRESLAAQIGAPVRFVDQIESMYAAGARIFVEAGPGQALTNLVRDTLGERTHLAVACDGGLRGLLIALGHLACAGVPVQPGWLFRGRGPVEVTAPNSHDYPMWLVDGQLVRDHRGEPLRGGMQPPRLIKEWSTMGKRDDLLNEYLRTSRDLIASQRDVMLAYLGGGETGRLVWQPSESSVPAAQPAVDAASVPAPAVAEIAAPAEQEAPVKLDFQGAVLAVISDRTGYPLELISPDLDVEADLGIDSIKRAEIAGAVAMRLKLPTEGDRALLEDLVRARTVRAMVAWLEEKVAGSGAATVPDPAPTQKGPASAAGATTPIRLVPRLVAIPGEAANADILTGKRFSIVGSLPELEARLREHGATLVDGQPCDAVVFAEPQLPEDFEAIQQALAAGPRWLYAVGGSEGLPGLFRTIEREYPDLLVRVVTAGDVFDELLIDARQPVVRRTPEGRFSYDLVAERLETPGIGPDDDGTAEAAALGLGRDSVVVLIGGARGITPWVAQAIATASRCRIELAGRTMLADEPDGIAADDLAGVRAALVAQGMREPAEIERRARAVMADREIHATMTELRALGAQVRYRSLDVRDEEATHRMIKEIHSEYGRIDGVVFAAGIIEDRLIAEKQPASFARVYSTKVDGARAVLNALDELPGRPKFVVLFGSVAAAYGNRGQADYAAANDAIDTIASAWAQRTGNRCLTVHWGPWAPKAGHGGMVTASLEAEFATRGVRLIEPGEGARCLLRELAWGDPATTSVVYTASNI